MEILAQFMQLNKRNWLNIWVPRITDLEKFGETTSEVFLAYDMVNATDIGLIQVACKVKKGLFMTALWPPVVMPQA